jgi:hypothetical protein
MSLNPDDRTDLPPAETREQRRSRRKREIRATTINIKRMTKRELEVGRAEFPLELGWRPLTRGDCVDLVRPCPFVACRYHLFVDVSPVTGAIKLNFPDLEPDQLQQSCALDVADRGGTTLEDVGAIINLTRERIRQVETKAMAKLELAREMLVVRELVDEGPHGKRRLPILVEPDEDSDDDFETDTDWNEEEEVVA